MPHDQSALSAARRRFAAKGPEVFDTASSSLAMSERLTASALSW